MTSWKDCANNEHESLRKLKTVLELYDLEIHQKKIGPDYHRLKTMVKRSIEQNLRIKNFEAKNGYYETNAVVKNQRTKQACTKNSWSLLAVESQRAVFWRRQLQFPARDMNMRAKPTQPSLSPRSSTRQTLKNASRTRSPRGRSPSGRMSRLPCKDYLKGSCTNSFCEKWHPSECLFYKSENGCRFGEKCSYAHRQVDEQPSKRSKKNGDKSAVAMLKSTRHFGFRISGYGAAEVFIDFAEELKHTETNPMCSIHSSRRTSCWHSRPKSIAWNDLPRWSLSA